MSSQSSIEDEQNQCQWNFSSSQSKELPVRSIKVVGLSKQTTLWEVEELFSRCGRVEQCKMELSCGIFETFVTFYDEEDAERALEDGNSEKLVLHNKVLLVSPIGDQPPRSTEESNIDMLNNDCLSEIFLYLPFEDRIRIERVCKRWQTISLASWRYNKYFTFSEPAWKFLKASNGNFNFAKLRKILKRCGSHPKEIDLPYISSDTSVDVFMDVAELCSNLQVVDMAIDLLSANVIKLLTRNCHDIRCFKLSSQKSPEISALSELFKQTTKLTHLEVDFPLEHALLCLPSTIQVLQLMSCGEVDLVCLTQVLPKFKNLSRLSLYGGKQNLSVGVMEALSTHCHQLEELSIAAFNVPRCQIHITSLTSLQIYIECKISNYFLLDLSSKCKNLMDLHISGDDITVAGIRTLAALPKLEKLKILGNRESLMPAWSKELPSISSFLSLKHLSLVYCDFLTPSDIWDLVECSPLLQVLKLVYVTDKYSKEFQRFSQTSDRNVKVQYWCCFSESDD